MYSQEDRGGWTPGRILGLIVGLVGMVGFGGCSFWFGPVLMVSLGGRTDGNFWPTGSWSALFDLLSFRDLLASLFFCGGLAIAFLFFLLTRAMIRRARKSPREAGPCE